MSNIKVSLFKTPAWFNKKEDEFEPLKDGELEQLFSSVDSKQQNKIKELLLKSSLSQ